MPTRRGTVPHPRPERGAAWDRIAEWAHAHVEQLAEEYGGVELRRGRCACPLHGGDNPDAFSVTNGKGWHCFTGDCGSGDGVALVALLTNRDRLDVLRELAPRAGVVLDEPTPGARRRLAPPTDTPARAPGTPPAPPPVWWETELAALRATGNVPARPAEMHTTLFTALDLGPLGRAYLAGRGFDPDAAHAYGFRSVEDAAAWAHAEAVLGADYLPAERASAALQRLPMQYAPALLIPYRSPDGRAVVGFNGRAMSATLTPRYRKPTGARLTVPFNAPALDGLTPAHTLHVVEGELNAYTLHTYGARALSLGSATGATALVRQLAPTLCAAGRVVLWFDDDKAGEKGFQAVRGALAPHIRAAGTPPTVTRQRIRKAHEHDAKDVNDLHRTGALAAVLDALETAAWPM